MFLSVVIPAYNEQVHIQATIESIVHAINRGRPISYEIIVSDDASTDNTAAVASKQGAIVVYSGKRNIGATRNAGAAAARGEYLLFLDADTIVPPATVQEMLQTIDQGAIAGGAVIDWSEPTRSWVGRFGLSVWNRLSKTFSWPAGSFFYVRRDAFNRAGGFDERYYVSEELHLGRRLKRLGKVTIVKNPVLTSPRKLHQFTLFEFARFVTLSILRPRKTMRNPKHLNIWYERRH